MAQGGYRAGLVDARADPGPLVAEFAAGARLAADYPLFRGGLDEAKALVDDGKIALILDGLDEMDEAARPAALRALSDAPFRVVVLSRSDEMVQATGAAWLVGAVALHLHDVTGPEAVDYLQRARTGPTPSGWAQLLSELREDPDNVVTRTLTHPQLIGVLVFGLTFGLTFGLDDALARARLGFRVRGRAPVRARVRARGPRA